ncbi:unnamed protein product [Allacma fusca]|uniref:Uncharacterized protein n=1 Tax=Allacma fusca TaxID=39272 RepID=A0A8J2LWS2_9HEXA|nr:unnamed protein product [Allacma fusca]
MRLRIRNTPCHANVLNLKKKAYQKGKYLSAISKSNRSRPVKSIRKTERSNLSKSLWLNDEDDDDDDDEDDDGVDGDDDDDDEDEDEDDEDLLSSPDLKIEDEDVDLPTVDRPYSKLISFQKHQQCGSQEVEDATNNHSTQNSSSSDKINGVAQLKFYSAASEIITPGKGSKNLAFLRQQLVDQLKKERGGKPEKWSQRDNRINHCSGFNTVESEFTTPETKASPHYTDFQQIADFIPIPQTLDDFEMTLFHDFTDKLDAMEWELVQELLFKSNIHNDQLDQTWRQNSLGQVQKGLEDDVIGNFTS